MTEQYRIVGIYYSKPHLYHLGSGEVAPGRIGVGIAVNTIDDFKVVARIEFDNDLNSFKIHYTNGSLKVIPKSYDCEVTYELIDNGKPQNKANKK